MNVVMTWLSLIGNPERARKLRARIDGLTSPIPIDPLFGPEPNQCPTTVLFGAEVARLLYADGNYRPALDAWDNESVSKGDIRRFCLAIEKEECTPDAIFFPDATWRAYVRNETRQNALKVTLLRQTPEPRRKESRGLNGRGQRRPLRDTVLS